ncbi:MAG TPA: terminase small subunit [Cyclobacteriaceae bacterium]|nr:terminase small subunit [Cyclobacteriaceae bacterium]
MAGRPLLFKDAETLQLEIDKYFASTKKEEWTITGLAISLNTSRETLINYQEREQFFDTIKKAKDMVENSYEIDLKKKGHSGSIFALKNFGWLDKQEINQKTTFKDDRIDESKLTDDELRTLVEIQRKSSISEA